MLIFTQRLSADVDATVSFTLSLTAEERTRTRHRFETTDGQGLYLRLPRGTVLHDGDLLQSEECDAVIRIAAKPEPVLTVTAQKPIDLLRASYHLGNRHVPLEVCSQLFTVVSRPGVTDNVGTVGGESTRGSCTFSTRNWSL
jgi:urease accessory protein